MPESCDCIIAVCDVFPVADSLPQFTHFYLTYSKLVTDFRNFCQPSEPENYFFYSSFDQLVWGWLSRTMLQNQHCQDVFRWSSSKFWSVAIRQVLRVSAPDIVQRGKTEIRHGQHPVKGKVPVAGAKRSLAAIRNPPRNRGCLYD